MTHRLRIVWILSAALFGWLLAVGPCAPTAPIAAWTHDEDIAHVHPGLASPDDAVVVEDAEPEPEGNEPPPTDGDGPAAVRLRDSGAVLAVQKLDLSAPPTGPPHAAPAVAGFDHRSTWLARGPPCPTAEPVV